MNAYNQITPETIQEDMRYLQLLSRSFPTIADASTEIINLEAILNLPKGTEHFLADLHGEYEAFQHVLRNASGAIKRKVNEIFGNTLRENEKKELCTLIYYPEQKLDLIKGVETDIDDWYVITLNQLVRVCQNVSSKYTRSKVRKALPKEFSYIIQELLHESSMVPNKQAYINVIISTIISTRRADDFIIALCQLIQRLTIDTLHVLGDIFDRGPAPHRIMDILCNYHNFDVQWGNHDILWMGAAAGNECCMANVLRLAMRYGNLSVLEDGYGINLLPLATFAMETYAEDPCSLFGPKVEGQECPYNEKTLRMIAQMHKAISIIQFKLEAEIIKRRPDFEMDDRMLLHRIDFERNILTLDGKEYELKDCFLPTVDSADPYKLTPEEREIMNKLHHSFVSSEKLKKHMRCLFRYGCMYTVSNSNLLFHASVPLNEDGSLKEVMISGKAYKGKKLLEKVGHLIRTAYFAEEDNEEKQFAIDYVWYLWSGKDSPAFDKNKMATFERYFLKEKELHKEIKGHYYTLRNEEKVCDMLLDEFGVVGKHRHIINGHVPVKTIQGENPIKANGKMMVIDGGFSRAYHSETGIAGYTLVYHSRGFQLVQHEPFTSMQKAIEEGQDIKSSTQIVELSSQRMMVKDTDKGRELVTQINDLKKLLVAYRMGLIKEKAL
ncbi:fructose-1,6-bisphosphatase [Phocaeicola faecalis]|jgi:fructose-1,6-bisphosphatase-3|uniref:fructose-1,6-bisphosphatase n=1 Tax=Phocaeicola faecalis TaxID=2786956 RepID=UPI001F1E616E|nr:fructose-1,6-bisphosphatase [Phocaeicola faecalis]